MPLIRMFGLRYLTNDDPQQARTALEVLAGADGVYITKSIMLELEWVLRAAYKLPSATIVKALMHILGLSIVHAEMPEQVAKALDFFTKGVDFADALHLASLPEDVKMMTFDAKFAKSAGALGKAVELM